jgi:hypothetical protein
MLLRSLLNDQYAPLRGLKIRAHRQYELTLDRWAEHLGREPAVADLSGLPVQAFEWFGSPRMSAMHAVKGPS